MSGDSEDLEEIKKAFQVDEKSLQDLLDSGEVDKEGSRQIEKSFDSELQQEELRSKKLGNDEIEGKNKARPYIFGFMFLLCISLIAATSYVLYCSIFGNLNLHHSVQCSLIVLMGGSGFGLVKGISDYFVS